MKYTIDGNCRVCKELRPQTIVEIYEKMNFIEDNTEQFAELLLKQYPMDKISKEFKGKPKLLSSLMTEVIIDLDVAVDEFHIKVEGEHDEYILIELLNEEFAEANDRDFVNENEGYSKEELATYCLGKTLSIYTKLSDKFYFRFL